jgi:hypothetical protein
MRCATHTTGNCPPGCPDVLRANPTQAEEGRFIERQKADEAHKAIDEAYRIACDRLGIEP